MSSSISILKKMSIYFIGTLSTRILSTLLIPIYAYFVSATDLGEFDYIVAISSIVYPIAYLAIWEAILRYYIKQSDRLDREILLSTVVFLALLISFLLIFMSLFIALLLDFNLSIIFIVFFTVTQGITSVWQFSTRALSETKWYVISSIVGAVSIIGLEIIFISLGQLDYVALSISYLISQILVVVVLEFKIRLLKIVRIGKVSLSTIKKMLIFTIPLVINNVSLYLYNSGSKVIIRNYIGLRENGLYSFASKFSLLIGLFSTVVSMAVIEEAYSFTSLDEYKSKMSVIITKISKGYFSLIIMALPAIYTLYFVAFRNTEYYNSVDYIFLLLIGALFTALSNNFGSAFQVTDHTKYISLTTLLGAAVAIIASLLTVTKIGMYGVLISGAFGSFIMMLTRAIYANKSTGLSVSWIHFINLLLIALLEYVCLIIFDNFIVYITLFLISFFFVGMINKEEFKIIYNKIFKKGNQYI